MATAYDIILFGSTGFTGKLALSYILQHPDFADRKWAISGRSAERLKQALDGCKQKVNEAKQNGTATRGVVASEPDIVVVDLNSEESSEQEKLKGIVLKTKVCMTTAGPFAKYGESLVKACAECGADYVDINGESDFVRDMIEAYDETAKESGSRIVMQCGHDCVPWELSFTELDRHVKSKYGADSRMTGLRTHSCGIGAPSGGTLDSMFYHAVEKPKKQKSTLGFDPLLKLSGNVKSDSLTSVKTARGVQQSQELSEYVGKPAWCETWVMAPVMGNAIRRTNAILKLAPGLVTCDSIMLPDEDSSFIGRTKRTIMMGAFGLALVFSPWRWAMRKYFLPKAGSGPTEEEMDKSFADIYAFADAKVKGAKGEEKTVKVASKMSFFTDIGYKDTARMLVDSGLCLLVDKKKTGGDGGVTQPGAVLGEVLLNRLLKEGKTTWTITDL